jgi:hypothetical protein
MYKTKKSFFIELFAELYRVEESVSLGLSLVAQAGGQALGLQAENRSPKWADSPPLSSDPEYLPSAA